MSVLSKGADGRKSSVVGYLYTAFVIGVVVLINNLSDAWWSGFKERESRKPVTLKPDSSGVHVPVPGIVQKVQKAGKILGIVWGINMLIWIGLVIYYKS